MKNSYCDMTREQINAVPDRFKGFFLSPFQFNLRGGMVAVPEDTFKEMIDIIAEYAVKSASAQASQAAASEVRESATDKAIQRAAAELPDGYEVIIELENGAGGVVWIDEHGARQIIEGEGHISDDINEAIDCALQHAAPELRTNPATPASKPEGSAK